MPAVRFRPTTAADRGATGTATAAGVGEIGSAETETVETATAAGGVGTLSVWVDPGLGAKVPKELSGPGAASRATAAIVPLCRWLSRRTERTSASSCPVGRPSRPFRPSLAIAPNLVPWSRVVI